MKSTFFTDLLSIQDNHIYWFWIVETFGVLNSESSTTLCLSLIPGGYVLFKKITFKQLGYHSNDICKSFETSIITRS